MFVWSKLKVKVYLATGREFCTGTKHLLLITFTTGLEHIINFYIVNKLTTLVVLGMQ